MLADLNNRKIVAFVVVSKNNSGSTYYLVDNSDGGGPAYSWSSTFREAKLYSNKDDIDLSRLPEHVIGHIIEAAIFTVDVIPLAQIDIENIPHIKKKRLVANARSKLTKEELEALGVE